MEPKQGQNYNTRSPRLGFRLGFVNGRFGAPANVSAENRNQVQGVIGWDPLQATQKFHQNSTEPLLNCNCSSLALTVLGA